MLIPTLVKEEVQTFAKEQGLTDQAALSLHLAIARAAIDALEKYHTSCLVNYNMYQELLKFLRQQK